MKHAERICKLKEHPALGTLKAKKIGLVLAGGGAKGAYQIGCLKCLQDLGLVQFHAICGVSVGALNGVSAASEKIREAVSLWEGIGFRQVFKTSPSFLLGIASYLVGGILIVNNKIIGLYICLAAIFMPLPVLFFRPSLTLYYFLWCILLVYFFAMRGQRGGRLIHLLGNHLIRSTHSRASLSDQSRLRDLVEQFLFAEPDERTNVQSQTFLVIARDGYWFDPDFPTFRIEAPPPGDPDTHYAIDKPVLKHGWLPEYIPVSGLPKDDILKVLLESAALPVVFRHTRKDYGLCTDGGMADNVPLNKILETGCDCVFVIQMNRELDSIDKLLDHVKSIRRSIKLESSIRRNGKQSLKTHALYKKYRVWLKNKLAQFRNNPELDKCDYRNKSYPIDPGLFQDFDLLDFLIPIIGKRNVIGADYYNHNQAERWRLFHTWDLLHTGRPELAPYEPLKNLPRIINVIPSQELGGFLLGTLGFRAKKARRLIDLGYVDMIACVEELLPQLAVEAN